MVGIEGPTPWDDALGGGGVGFGRMVGQGGGERVVGRGGNGGRVLGHGAGTMS